MSTHCIKALVVATALILSAHALAAPDAAGTGTGTATAAGTAAGTGVGSGTVAPKPPEPGTASAVGTATGTGTTMGTGTGSGAPAVDANKQTWWMALIYDLSIKVVLPILLPVLAAFGVWVARKVGANVELKTLDSVAERAAVHAEKLAAKWLRENGEKADGAKKERWAFELAESIDKSFGGRAKLRDKLRALILAKIPDAEKKIAESETAKNGDKSSAS